MARVKLKDGRIVDIPFQPDWDDAAKDRAIAEYKANPDPAETDDWGTYAGKHAKATAVGGGGGLASTIDFLGNTIGVAPRIAYNLWNDKPALTGFGGTAVRDTYEKYAPDVPRGSDYETNAAISEIAVPAVVETLATGSPKSALLRAPRDVALGIGGGMIGEEAAERIGGEEYSELGRTIGSVVAPGAASRTAARSLSGGIGWLTRPLKKYGLDPFNLIPASTPVDIAKRALTGGSASSAYDYVEGR